MPRVFYATGHYRNGILLAPATAQLVADLVLEQRERSELAFTRPARIGL
jgi:glycine oxidase